MNSVKNQIFLQARTGSTRLPKKVLLRIDGKTIIEILLERLRKVKNVGRIILVTSSEGKDNELAREAARLGMEVFRGSEDNVLDRLYQASQKFNSDNIIRVTGDCPLIDFDLINQGLEIFEAGDFDILSNIRIRTFPDGFDFDILRTKALEIAWKDNFDQFGLDYERFTQEEMNPVKYLLEEKKFKTKDFLSKENLSRIRLTLDYKEDFDLVREIYQRLVSQDKYFGMEKILKLLKENPELRGLNEKYVRLDYGVKAENN